MSPRMPRICPAARCRLLRQPADLLCDDGEPGDHAPRAGSLDRRVEREEFDCSASSATEPVIPPQPERLLGEGEHAFADRAVI